MLYGCGFRISELLNLKLSDVDTEKGWVHVLHAKNDNERFVPMAESLNLRCKAYILTAHKGHSRILHFSSKERQQIYRK